MIFIQEQHHNFSKPWNYTWPWYLNSWKIKLGNKMFFTWQTVQVASKYYKWLNNHSSEKYFCSNVFVLNVFFLSFFNFFVMLSLSQNNRIHVCPRLLAQLYVKVLKLHEIVKMHHTNIKSIRLAIKCWFSFDNPQSYYIIVLISLFPPFSLSCGQFYKTFYGRNYVASGVTQSKS